MSILYQEKYLDSICIVFFGHRFIYNIQKVRKRLLDCVEEYINKGANNFLIGTHGEFDKLALSVCRELKKKFPHIKTSVVFTSLSFLKNNKYKFCDYEDVETYTYSIEEVYYKNRINVTNNYMINDSDIVICYVDTDKKNSGAQRAVNYAKKQNKVIINLFDERDSPYYGLTFEESLLKYNKLNKLK